MDGKITNHTNQDFVFSTTDLHCKILSFLAFFRDVLRCHLVCKEWNVHCKDPSSVEYLDFYADCLHWSPQDYQQRGNINPSDMKRFKNIKHLIFDMSNFTYTKTPHINVIHALTQSFHQFSKICKLNLTLSEKYKVSRACMPPLMRALKKNSLNLTNVSIAGKWFALFELNEKNYIECRHDKLIMLLTQANYYNLKDLNVYRINLNFNEKDEYKHLFLNNMPNLESLSLRDVILPISYFYDLADNNNNNNNNTLKKLKHLLLNNIYFTLNSVASDDVSNEIKRRQVMINIGKKLVNLESIVLMDNKVYNYYFDELIYYISFAQSKSESKRLKSLHYTMEHGNSFGNIIKNNNRFNLTSISLGNVCRVKRENFSNIVNLFVASQSNSVNNNSSNKNSSNIEVLNLSCRSGINAHEETYPEFVSLLGKLKFDRLKRIDLYFENVGIEDDILPMLNTFKSIIKEKNNFNVFALFLRLHDFFTQDDNSHDLKEMFEIFEKWINEIVLNVNMQTEYLLSEYVKQYQAIRETIFGKTKISKSHEKSIIEWCENEENQRSYRKYKFFSQIYQGNSQRSRQWGDDDTDHYTLWITVGNVNDRD